MQLCGNEEALQRFSHLANTCSSRLNLGNVLNSIFSFSNHIFSSFSVQWNELFSFCSVLSLLKILSSHWSLTFITKTICQFQDVILKLIWIELIMKGEETQFVDSSGRGQGSLQLLAIRETVFKQFFRSNLDNCDCSSGNVKNILKEPAKWLCQMSRFTFTVSRKLDGNCYANE